MTEHTDTTHVCNPTDNGPPFVPPPVIVLPVLPEVKR